jgi:hypothetical protein
MKILNKQKGFWQLGLLALVFWLVIIVSWVKNVYELTQCDFDPSTSYKCEVLHGAGLIPIISVFTGWVDLGK